MALTTEQEKGLLQVLDAFKNGKRINDLEQAKGALKDMNIEVMDETGETRRMELAAAVEQAGNPSAGRYWIDGNSSPKAAGYYGSLQALRELPDKLGLGRYLVTDDRKKRKLDPTDSTRYIDGTPAALDGTQGQCMWCWNGFYANVWKENGRTVKTVTLNKPEGYGLSFYIPAGGISWIGAGVMDRTETKLCSVISDAERFRGGGGSALTAASYKNAPAEAAPQISMLGMPATNISTINFGTYARKRGEGWEANWFVARFVIEFLFEIIMGTNDSQAAFSQEKDANGLYQGGFGAGVSTMHGWDSYNGYYPVVPTKTGLEAGDGVCLVDCELPTAAGGVYHTFKVGVFFGLVGAGYGHLYSWVRGLIMNAGAEKSEVYVSKSMYAPFDPARVEDKVKVAECPRTSGYIKQKSYAGMCCMPTEIGGSSSTYYPDYFYTNAAESQGLRVRAAGGNAIGGANAGASDAFSNSAATTAATSCSSPLCYFEADPSIEDAKATPAAAAAEATQGMKA